ncbi:hypothetical protein F5888DRAFT_1805986 [Russula emetica]|nr:hypothetical protein F5888DRAFT_1805986 [Russula emetica]
MPPHHPAAEGGCQCPSIAPNPVIPTPSGLSESDHEDDRASRSEQPSPDGSPEREDSVSLLSLPSSYLHLNRVLGHHYMALAMTVRPPSHKSVTHSAPRENHQFVQPCGQMHVYNRYMFPAHGKRKHDEVNTPLSSMMWRTESERASEIFAEFVQNECQTYFPCSLCLLEILLTGLLSGFTQLRVALIGIIQSRHQVMLSCSLASLEESPDAGRYRPERGEVLRVQIKK